MQEGTPETTGGPDPPSRPSYPAPTPCLGSSVPSGVSPSTPLSIPQHSQQNSRPPRPSFAHLPAPTSPAPLPPSPCSVGAGGCGGPSRMPPPPRPDLVSRVCGGSPRTSLGSGNRPSSPGTRCSPATPPTVVPHPRIVARTSRDSSDGSEEKHSWISASTPELPSPLSGRSTTPQGAAGVGVQAQAPTTWKLAVTERSCEDLVGTAQQGRGKWRRGVPEELKEAVSVAEALLESVGKKAEEASPRGADGEIVWMEDDESSVCMLCCSPFSFTTRRHHCRRCGRIFCSSCSQFRLPVPHSPSTTPQRLCAGCFVGLLCFGAERGLARSPPARPPTAPASVGKSATFGAARAISIPALGTGHSPVSSTAPNCAPRILSSSSGMTVIGSVPSRTVSARYTLSQGEGSKEERQRAAVLKEIVMTEKDYVDDLGVLIDVFETPLRANELLSQEQLQSIFSDVNMIAPIHRELLDKLLRDYQVGEAFETMCAFLKMYGRYTANFDRAMETVSKLKETSQSFAKALAAGQADPRTRGLDLVAFLILPIQRLCKYPLLLRDLLRATPESHPEYPALARARDKMDEVVKHVNEEKRQFEEQQKVVDVYKAIAGEWEEHLVTPSRRLLLDVRLRGRDLHTQKLHDYVLYIFSDLVVVAKVVWGGLKLKGEIPMAQCRLVIVGDTEDVKNSFEVVKASSTPVTESPLVTTESLTMTSSPLPPSPPWPPAHGPGRGMVGFRFFAQSEPEHREITRAIRMQINEVLKRHMKKSSASLPLMSATPPTR